MFTKKCVTLHLIIFFTHKNTYHYDNEKET